MGTEESFFVRNNLASAKVTLYIIAELAITILFVYF